MCKIALTLLASVLLLASLCACGKAPANVNDPDVINVAKAQVDLQKAASDAGSGDDKCDKFAAIVDGLDDNYPTLDADLASVSANKDKVVSAVYLTFKNGSISGIADLESIKTDCPEIAKALDEAFGDYNAAVDAAAK